jgi:hypothetical protein
MPGKQNGGRAPLAEWRGSVTATLDSLKAQVSALADNFKELSDRVEKIDRAQIIVATKIAVYGGLAGSVVAGLAHFLLKVLGA